MQLELMTDRLRKYLKENFGMTEDHFVELCGHDVDEDPELHQLLHDLSMKECDDSDWEKEHGEYPKDGGCATELIDIICGPYDKDYDDENDDA